MSDDRYSFPCITDVSQTFLRNHLRDRILELLPCGLCKLWLSMSMGNLKPFAEALGLEDGTLLIILRAAGCIVGATTKMSGFKVFLKEDYSDSARDKETQ
jgi:hypothetical protein